MTKRSESYWIRLTPEELADWRRRAATLSISVAELVRMQMQARVRKPPEPSPIVASVGTHSDPKANGVGLAQSFRPLADREDRPSRVSGGLGQTEVTPRFKAAAKVKG